MERIEDVLRSVNDDLKAQKIDPFQRLDYKNIQSVPRVPSGVLSLDWILGGGYPKGRIVELYGPNSSGKSSLTLQAIASSQSRGGIAAFLDTEHALDVSYAEKLGVQVGDLLFHQPDYGEQALSILDSLTNVLHNGDLVVVDSVAALTPREELEGGFDDKTPMRLAAMMSKAMSKLKGKISKSGVTVLFTNQVRSTLGYGNTTTGGNALKFYASQRIELKSISKIIQKSGQKEDVIGNKTLIKVVKNKVAPPFMQVITEIRFGEGVPFALDLINLAVATNPQIVITKGSWYSYGDISLGQGITNAYKFLQEHPEVLVNVEADVRQSYGLSF